MKPRNERLHFVNPPPNKVIILAPVNDDEEPNFVIVGKTRCVSCDCWCWLGDETFAIVSRGGASPLCHPCACTIPELCENMPLRLVQDRRKDQP